MNHFQTGLFWSFSEQVHLFWTEKASIFHTKQVKKIAENIYSFLWMLLTLERHQPFVGTVLQGRKCHVLLKSWCNQNILGTWEMVHILVHVHEEIKVTASSRKKMIFLFPLVIVY